MAVRVDATNATLPTGDCVQADLMANNIDAVMLPAPVDDDKNFESICLRAPIKIILPVDEAANEQQSEPRPNAIMTPTPTFTDESTTEEAGCDEENVSPLCPYIVGNNIFLKATDKNVRIEAEIMKYFPATLSCVMVLRFLDPPVYNNVSQCVVKLYDRRFSTQLRSDEGAVPWTPGVESLYQDFVASEDAAEFFSYWNAGRATNIYWSGRSVGTRNRWSQAKVEAYLQWETTSTYEDEKKAYELMADLQGDIVPKMLGEVVLNLAVDTQEAEGPDSVMFDDSTDSDHNPHISSIPGLLLQYVEGFQLTHLVANQPREQWQSTVDSAIVTLRRIQDCGILNRDVNIRSFMVDSITHRVMMLDFGLVFFRDQVKEDREWESSQAVQDEEGAIGLGMESMLNAGASGSYIYRPGELALKLSYRFNDENGEQEGGTEEEEKYLKKYMGQSWDYDPDEE
ncbi:hypothetical protein D6C98_05371 [Aureobasidium pullulans]|nr:hypothetical protein D6C98_05371 [Aureobasidium pullulans]